MVSDAIACPLHNLNTVWYIFMILQLYRKGDDDVSRTRIKTLTFILSELFPLVSDAISCPLFNLKTLWNTIMILHSYVEHISTMCCIQELQLSLSYFLSYLPLMVKATMPSFLTTIKNIFTRLYNSVEEVMKMCRV